MPTDWTYPTLASTYSDLVALFKARDEDALTLSNVLPTNIPDHAFCYDRTSGEFREYSLGTGLWTAILIELANGGTGATTAAGARTKLGLGSIAIQDKSAIDITGGALTGITALGLAGNVTFTGSRAIGTNAIPASKIYLGDGLKLPVGTDKYLTS